MKAFSEGTLTAAESLITHLQTTAEIDKADLARELHDELGGLMVAAVMDLASVQQLQSHKCEPMRERLDRVKETLESAIDLKRRIIEELRPSILDNFGLVEAIKWQMKRNCGDSGVVCRGYYPQRELHLSPDVSIGLFRVAQESLALSFKRAGVTAVELRIEIAGENLCLSVSDDGLSEQSREECAATATTLASMRHRMRVLDGDVEFNQTAHVSPEPQRGHVMMARIPMPA